MITEIMRDSMYYNKMRILLLLIFSVILISQANAFRAEITNDYLCCGISEVFVNITNTLNKEKDFTISFNGNIFSQNIPAQTSKVISVMMPVECNKLNNIEMSISTDVESYLLSRLLPAKNCPAVSVAIINNISTCPNIISELPFQIINPSKSPQAYSISFSNKQDYIRVSDNNFVLEPNSAKDLIIFFQMPDTNLERETILMTVRSTTSSQQITIPIEISYDNCYQYTISSQDAIICKDYENKIPVTIAGNHPMDILLSDNLAYGYFANDNIRIMNGTIDFIVKPSIKGEKEVTIYAKSASRTEKVKINIESVDCSELAIIMPDKINIQDCSEQKIPVKIRNNGLFTHNLTLSLSAPEWATLENQQSITLAEGEEWLTNIIMRPCGNEGTHKLKLATGVSEKDFYVKVSGKKSYYAKVSLSKKKLQPGINEVEFKVKNLKESASYTIKVEGNNTEFPPQVVNFEEGESKSFSFKINMQNNSDEQVAIKVSRDDYIVVSKSFTLTTKEIFGKTFLFVVAIILAIVLIIILIMIILEISKKKEKSLSIKEMGDYEKEKVGEKKEEKQKTKKSEQSKLAKKEKFYTKQPEKKPYLTYIVPIIIVLLIAVILSIPLIKNVNKEKNATNTSEEVNNESEVQPTENQQNESVKAEDPIKNFFNQFKWFIGSGILLAIILILVIEIIKRRKNS